MKKKLLLFFAVFAFTVLLFGLLAVNTSAATYSGNCGANGDNLTWTLDTNTGILEIKGEGEMANWSWTSGPWGSYRSSIKSVALPEGLTSIVSYAFSGCDSLTNISIPSSVTSIGSYAFYNCTSLTSVTFGANSQLTSIGSSAFRDCTSLTSIEIPSTVTSIGEYAFENCTSLTSIEIPSSVTSIGSQAFRECDSLTSITLPFVGATKDGTSNTSFDYIFGLSVPASLKTVIITGGTSIGDWAFSGCSSLESIEIPSSVTSIGYYAFDNCTSLTSVTFGENSQLTSIGSDAFSSCDSLTSIEIPSTVTSIGNWAFSGCSSLTSIEIPSSVTSIGAYAFSNCTALTSIEILSTVTSIGYYAFYNTGYYNTASNWKNHVLYIGNWLIKAVASLSGGYTVKAGTVGIADDAFSGTRLTSIEIPSTVTSIGSSAFENCTRLTSISIPSSVKSIGSSAFRDCTSLTSVTFGENSQLTSIGSSAFRDCTSLTSVTFGENSQLTSIGGAAFYGCSRLTSIEIPSSVTSIGGSAFEGCSRLTSIEIPSSVTSIGSGAFYGCSSLTSIEIPSSVTSIGYHAFYNTGYYNTASNWENDVLYIGNWLIGAKTSLSGSYTVKDGTVGICNSFLGCARLTSIEIPDSVTSINSSEFRDCTSLTSISIPSSVTSIGSYAFENCTSLTSISIPSSVTTIGSYAFSGCSRLTSVTFGENSQLTSIGEYAFENCTSLMSVTFGENSQLTSIGEYAFSNCDSLTSITIPTSVTSIGSSAFSWCDSLTNISIPSSVTSIGNGAFSGCTSLASITIPSSVTSIGSSAFSGCSSLVSIEIPSSLLYLGHCAFSGCENLKIVYVLSAAIAENVELSFDCFFDFDCLEHNVCQTSNFAICGSSNNIEEWYEFHDIAVHNGNVFYVYSDHSHAEDASVWEEQTEGNDTYKKCSSCGFTKDVNFVAAWDLAEYENQCLLAVLYAMEDGYELEIVGSGAMPDFYDAPWHSYSASIKRVTISDGVTGISGFGGCSSLTSIEIPSSVTSIGSSAFSYCDSLTSVTFGANSRLKSIGDGAFEGCSSLMSIEIPSSVTSIGNYAFSYCDSLTSVHITDIATWCGISFGDSYANPLNYAEEFYVNGVLLSDELVIPEGITSIGSYAFAGFTNLVSVTIPSSVRIIGGGAFFICDNLVNIRFSEESILESIGGSAFAYCRNLTSVKIPSTVTSIGYNAFYNCGITSVYIDDIAAWCGISFGNSSANPLNYAEEFYVNGVLLSDELVIPEGIVSIGSYAFADFQNLVSVTIPSSVRIIGSGAFSNCHGLTSVHITDIAAWCNISFGSYDANPFCYAKNLYLNGTLVTDLVIPSGVTSIGSYAFYSCDSLASVTFGANSQLTSIGGGAFYGCTRLTSITIPSSAMSIGSNAFYYCTSLASVTFAEGSKLTSIGDGAFSSCKSLASITIPTSVTSIGSYAFRDCTSLTSIEIPSSVTCFIGDLYYGSYAFSGCTSLTSVTFGENSQLTSIGSGAFYGCSRLTSIEIPSSVTSIGSSAFYGCSRLTSIEIPSSVTSIGSYAFENCTSLTRISIPSSVTSIGSYAFNNCTSLTNISIPSSVTSIGNGAFSNCKSLASITIPSSVTSIGQYAFENCTNLKVVYVLSPTVAAALTGSAYNICGFLSDVNYRMTFAIRSDITNTAEYIKTTYRYVDTIIYFGERYTVYSKHSHASNNSAWEIVNDNGFVIECRTCGLKNHDVCHIVGHDFTPPDCVTPSKCSRCDYVEPALGHDMQAATCTIPATCSRCEYTEGEALGHAMSEATCTVPSMCSRCGSVEGEALGHNLKAATCIAPSTCSRCDYTEGTALGHAMLPADCVTPSTCSRCEYTRGEALGHAMNEATCTLPSSCSRCDHTEGEALGHAMLPADCVTPSMCSRCDHTEGEALGHDMLPATCTAPSACSRCEYTEGEALRHDMLPADCVTPATCSRCDYTEGKALGHVMLPATNIVPSTCSRCGHTVGGVDPYIEEWDISANGDGSVIARIYDNDGNYSLKIFGNGAMKDWSWQNIPWWTYQADIKSVNIENGVTSIGSTAFYQCVKLSSITIPASVTSIGERAFSWCTSLWRVMFATGSKLEKIDILAFGDCTSLYDITIPAGVTSIGASAFSGCTRLSDITIPASVTSIGTSAFWKCTELTSVTFAEGIKLEKIEDDVFNECLNLREIEIPEGVTSIGYGAFLLCRALERVILPSSLKTVGGDAFAECYNICILQISDIAAWCGISFENEIANPLYYAKEFYLNYELITDLVIPEGVTSIGSYAFSYCGSLASITIPSSVTSIGSYAFSIGSVKRVYVFSPSIAAALTSSSASGGLTGATTLVFGTNIKNIAEYVKTYYTYADTIQYYEERYTVYSMHSHAENASVWQDYIDGNFEGKICSSCGLIKGAIDNYLKKWDISANGDGSVIAKLYDTNGGYALKITGIGAMKSWTSTSSVPWNPYRESIKVITMTEGITNIGAYAFYNCKYVTNIEIPASVSSIGVYSFAGCKALTKVDLPAAVKSISDYAFYYCTGFTNIEIPSAVENIGSYAFNNCSGLVTVRIPASVTSIGSYAFRYCTALKVVYIFSPDVASALTSASSCGYLCNAAVTFAIVSDITNVGSYVTSKFTNQETIHLMGETYTVYSTHQQNWQKHTTNSVLGQSYPFDGFKCSVCGILKEGASSAGKWNISATENDNVWARLDALIGGQYKLVIYGSGDMKSWSSSSYAPWYSSYAKHIVSVEVKEGVKSIGAWAFYNMGIHSAILPDSLETIGGSAFRVCQLLEWITIGKNVKEIKGDYVFYQCDKLQTVYISSPDVVKNLGSGYLQGKLLLNAKSVAIAKSITNITSFVLSTYPKKQNIEFMGKEYVLYSNHSHVWQEYALPYANAPMLNGKECATCGAMKGDFYDNVETLDVSLLEDETVMAGIYQNAAGQYVLILTGEGEMKNWTSSSHAPWYDIRTNLVEVIVNDGITSIGNYAFYNTSITSIVLPDSIETVGNSAFRVCAMLKTANLGSGIENIGSYCFYNCSALTSCTVSSPVFTVGDNAFSGCGKLSSIPKSVPIAEWTISAAATEEGEVNNVKAELYSLGNGRYRLVILGEGRMKDWSSSVSAPWHDYRAHITEIVVKDGVTTIGNWAFYSTAVEKIELPESVVAVGNSAFRFCQLLRTFSCGTAMESVGTYCFYQCVKLSSCTIKAPVFTVGNNAFAGCTALKKIPASVPVTSWNVSATASDNVIAKLYSLGGGQYRLVIEGTGNMKGYSSSNYAPWYDYHAHIKQIDIKDGITSIGNWAFYNLAIDSLIVPDSVTKIGNSAFRYCMLLKTAKLGKNAESLGTYCFYNCTKLTECTSSATVLSIGNNAFSGCTSLKKTPVKTPVASWDISSAGNGSLIASLYAVGTEYRLHITGTGAMKNYTSSSLAPWNKYAAKITAITFTEGITHIGNYAFYNAQVKTVALPASVVTIGNSAFRFCALLESVTVGKKLTSIGTYCFYNCSKLTVCTLPEGTAIGNKAFTGTPLA